MNSKSINPYNQSVIAIYEADNEVDIEQKVKSASEDFLVWKSLSFQEKGDKFKKLAAYLRENMEGLAKIITDEMGKIITESMAEIEKCAGQCEYYAENAEVLLKNDSIITEAKESSVGYQPIGVILAIMPWNFPFWQVFRYAVPALMAGNTTILKHAPNVFGCAKAIENAFLATDFPKGVFQSLIIDIEPIEKLLADDRIGMVTLTGSEKAGSIVASMAGKNIKKSVLELGGSDAFIIMPDADLEAASTAAVASRMMNAGQVCIAAKRFLVHDSVKNEFIFLLKTKIEKLVVGNPYDSATNIGPMARIDLAENIDNQLNMAINEGALVHILGNKNNCFVSPSLLEINNKNSIVFQEETFGPLAVIMPFETENEAIALANDNRYGLSAGIWTKNHEQAKRMANQLVVGSVFINSVVRSDARLPIGGTKKSGYGRELSELGIKEFCQAKMIYLN